LAHQTQQMRQRFRVGAALGFGELAGAFVELRRHVGGLLRRTTQSRQGLGEGGEVRGHCENGAEAANRFRAGMGRDRSYFTLSAGTILMLSTAMRLAGADPWGPPVGVVAIFSSTSSPLISLPKPVYLLSSEGAGAWQMKN